MNPRAHDLDRDQATWGPFLVIATVLGAAALVLMIAGVIMNSVTVLVGTAIVVIAIWVVTTAHRLTEAGPRPWLQGGR